MLQRGIVNPHLLSLLARVRHTNTLVIADIGFPFWPQIETVDLSLTAGVPTVAQVLDAIRANFSLGAVFAAVEFKQRNPPAVFKALQARLKGVPLHLEPHAVFKQRVPAAVGLVRTADPTPYANLILESA